MLIADSKRPIRQPSKSKSAFNNEEENVANMSEAIPTGNTD